MIDDNQLLRRLEAYLGETAYTIPDSPDRLDQVIELAMQKLREKQRTPFRWPVVRSPKSETALQKALCKATIRPTTP